MKQNNLFCNKKSAAHPKIIRAADEILFCRFPRRLVKPGRAKRGPAVAGRAAPDGAAGRESRVKPRGGKAAGDCRAARRGPPNPCRAALHAARINATPCTLSPAGIKRQMREPSPVTLTTPRKT